MQKTDFLTKENYLIYRGKPLIREKNTLCYGSMEDKYILFMIILSTKKVDGIDREVPDAVIVQILSTDVTRPAHERVVKQFNKNGLYDAFDVGVVWLDRMNNEP